MIYTMTEEQKIIDFKDIDIVSKYVSQEIKNQENPIMDSILFLIVSNSPYIYTTVKLKDGDVITIDQLKEFTSQVVNNIVERNFRKLNTNDSYVTQAKKEQNEIVQEYVNTNFYDINLSDYLVFDREKLNTNSILKNSESIELRMRFFK